MDVKVPSQDIVNTMDGGHTRSYGSVSRDQKSNLRENTIWRRFEGIFFSVLAAVFVVIASTSIKHLSQFNAPELILYNFLPGVFLSLPTVIAHGSAEPRERTIFLWGAMVTVTSLSLLTRGVAFQMLPLGDASSILFSMPFFTALFSRFILKDHISWMTIISLLLALLGLCLTVKLPTFADNTQINRGSIHHLIGCTYALMIGCSVISAAVTPIFGQFHALPCDPKDMTIILSMGISMYLSNISVLKALQTEDATTMTTVYRSTEMFLAFLSQAVIFKDAVDCYSVSGALVIFSCGLLMPLQRWMQNRDIGHWKIAWLLK